MDDDAQLDEAIRIVVEAERRLFDELGLSSTEVAHTLIGGGLTLLEDTCCKHRLVDELGIVTSAIERIRTGGSGTVN